VSDTGNRLGDDSEANAVRKPLLLKRLLLLYAGVVLAAGWSYGLWQINVDRKLTLDSSTNQLTLSATGFANHVTAMIHDGVGAAVAGASEIQSVSKTRTLTEEQMTAILGRMLVGGEYVRTLFFATPTRYVAANRDAPKTNNRPAFADEMLANVTSTWVGRPLNIEQGDTNVLIPIAKRAGTLNGEDVWAGALLSFTSLDALYRTLPVEYSGLALSHSAGILLVRVPTLPEYKFSGVDLSDSASTRTYLKLPTAPLVAYEAPDPFTNNPRQFAVRRLENYPLRATASRDVDNSLIEWRVRSRNSLLMLGVASLAVAGLTIALFLLLQRRFEALRLSQERFQLAVAGTNDGIWDWEIAANYVYYSQRFKECLGFTATDDFPPVTDTFWGLIHPDDAERTQAAVERHMKNREPYEVEYRMRTRSGEYRWFQARAQAVWDETGKPLRMAGSISDIHQKRLAEHSLRQAQSRELHAREEFAQRLILTQEQERQRLANELHDSVGQNLSLIKNRALMVLQKPDLPPEVTHHVGALSTLASDVIAEVRTVAQNLRPLHIEQLGLTDALDTLLKKIGESSALLIDSRLENVDDVLTGAAATHLYRIVQEALNNILKHARAPRCRVWLERDVSSIRLTISDNGVGFDMHTDDQFYGLGLASIAERVRMLAGKLHIDSTPLGRAGQCGTAIRIEIPIVESLTSESGMATDATTADLRP